MTALVCVPLIAGSTLAFGVVTRVRNEGRLPWRRTFAAIVLVGFGLALVLLPLPPGGLKFCCRLDGNTFVIFSHNYRIWPGRHVIPFLEIMNRDGESRVYPLDSIDSRYYFVNFRTNADRTVIWCVEHPGSKPRYRGVIASLNLVTGELTQAPGPFPAGVTADGGMSF